MRVSAWLKKKTRQNNGQNNQGGCCNIEKLGWSRGPHRIEVLSEMWGGERASDAVVTNLAPLIEHQISR